MKVRNGFITNSSSTLFIIENKTDKPKSLLDFVDENGQNLLDNCWFADDSTMWDLKENAIRDCDYRGGVEFPAKKEISIAFGDEDGDSLGRVFDYMLRDGGESESFRWEYKEALR